jgi:GntR family transcriptional repressor for pyruvate dehydrogenase complex
MTTHGHEVQSSSSDYLEYRYELEGSAASAAAQPRGLTGIFSTCVTRRWRPAHKASDAELQATIVSEFHTAIAEATHNVVFIHMTLALQQFLREEVLKTRMIIYDQKGRRQAVLEQHRNIKDAVCDQRPVFARAAMQEHISFVQECLSG